VLWGTGAARLVDQRVKAFLRQVLPWVTV